MGGHPSCNWVFVRRGKRAVWQISWKSSDEDDDEEVSISKDDDDDADDQFDDDQEYDGQEYDGQDDEGQDEVNEQTKSDNDGDDFVHPKFSTHDQEERQDEEDKQEEETNEEEEVNELYKDVNVNLEGRDTEMTDAPQTNVQGTQVTKDTHVIITAATPEVQQQSSSVSSGFISNMLNPNPDTGIDSILNLNTESTTLVDVPLTSNAEMPPSSVTTPLPPSIPPIQPLQQTPFEDRVKALEDDFSEFKQTNHFAPAVSLIPGIVDTLHQKLEDNIKKIIKEQVKAQVKEQVTKILPRIEKTVNEQLEAEVLTCSSNEAKTSHAVAAYLSELELNKFLIDKMESNKSIHRSDQQKTLYKTLVDAYESDKLILDTYGDTVKIKRRQDDQVEDEEPSAAAESNRRTPPTRTRNIVLDVFQGVLTLNQKAVYGCGAKRENVSTIRFGYWIPKMEAQDVKLSIKIQAERSSQPGNPGQLISQTLKHGNRRGKPPHVTQFRKIGKKIER
ncbi:hypothetical protein Tco_0013560 [Tanacetum coccineum]